MERLRFHPRLFFKKGETPQMKEKRNDLYSGIAFLAFGVFVYAFSFQIKPTTSDILGSRFFPQAVGIIIGLLAIVQIVGALNGIKAAKAGPAEEKKKAALSMPLVLTTVALFVYYFVIQLVGFVPTSIAYLLFQCYILMSDEERKNKKTVIIMALVSVLIPVFLNFVFWNIFRIRLPMGKLFK